MPFVIEGDASHLNAGEILDRVRAYGYGTDTAVPQLLMLNEVYKRVMNYRRWRFNAAHINLLTTKVGVSEYSISEADRLDALRGENLPLKHMDYQELRDRQTYETGTGCPQYWTQSGGSVIFWPTPDGEYQVKADILKDVEPLTTTNSTIVIPDDHAEILVWGTIVGICFRERDWEGHNFARQLYQEHLGELASEWGMTNRQTSSQVVESGWYDRYDPEDEWPI